MDDSDPRTTAAAAAGTAAPATTTAGLATAPPAATTAATISTSVEESKRFDAEDLEQQRQLRRANSEHERVLAVSATPDEDKAHQVLKEATR